MNGFISDAAGGFFSEYGAIVIGSAEFVTSVILLSSVVFWLLNKVKLIAAQPYRVVAHALGGLMAGAVFFHLVSPLGVEVLHQGKSDDGSFSLLANGFNTAFDDKSEEITIAILMPINP